MMDMANLEALVKWCIFDSARINGTYVDYGEVTKEVTYNGETAVITTTITEEDFDIFKRSKNCVFA